MAKQSGPPKILHMTTVPGTLFFLEGQIAYMRGRGFEVEALSSPGERLDDFTRQERIPVHAVNMPRQITPGQDLGALRQLCGLFRRLRPTIVHSHTPKAGLLGTFAARLAGVPVRIYHMHGLPLTTARGYRKALLTASERVACGSAHQVLCVSNSVREVAVAAGLCPPGKIKVLARGSINGVDAEGLFNPDRYPPDTGPQTRAALGIPADAPVIGAVGRLVGDKGVAELVGAFTELYAEDPSLRLLVIGRFEERDAVSDEVRRALTSHPGISLTGQVPHEGIAGYYAAMDILALPTYREGLPYVPIEAAAMGLPVVATRVPGCVDAVQDGVTGTLVPVRDARALADALRVYLRDPELRRSHGVAGRERVLRDFRPEDVWEATYQEYLRLLQERGLPLPAAGR